MMFVWITMKLCQISPWFKKLVWQRWYQYLAGYDVSDWRFMNYGYVALDDCESENETELLALDESDEPNRYAIQLYDFVGNAGESLEGRNVLEVGSGRGGGASFIKRYLHPSKMTGVDFSKKAIQFCQKHHDVSGLEFLHGDAENLPFDDESFDAVMNVESSHCYGSMPRFLAEVQRVLRPGGRFLFADLRTIGDVESLERQMSETQMTIETQADITPNVLEALRRDSARKSALIDQSLSKRWAGTFRRFAAVEGTDVFEAFRDGTMVYRHFVLRK